MATLTKLTCPSCGGKVDKDNSKDRYTCSYCGNQFFLSDEGGIVGTAFTSDLKKAASELAIRRLQADIDDLQVKMDPYREEWSRLTNAHNKYINYGKRAKIMVGALVVSFIAFFVAVLNDVMSVGLISTAVFVGSIFGLLYAGSKSVQRKKEEKDYLKMSSIMKPLEEKIAARRIEMKKHLDLVEN